MQGMWRLQWQRCVRRGDGVFRLQWQRCVRRGDGVFRLQRQRCVGRGDGRSGCNGRDALGAAMGVQVAMAEMRWARRWGVQVATAEMRCPQGVAFAVCGAAFGGRVRSAAGGWFFRAGRRLAEAFCCGGTARMSVSYSLGLWKIGTMGHEKRLMDVCLVANIPFLCGQINHLTQRYGFCEN